MFKTNFEKRPIIENSQVINVANFVRTNLLSTNERLIKADKPVLNLANESDLQKFIDAIKAKITLNLKQEISGQTSFSKENCVNLTYTKSNLGKGFIIWFVCNSCGHRTRYLYFPAYSEVLACRRCHRLSYKRQNRSKNDRLFDKLLY